MADAQDDYPAHLSTYEGFNKLVTFGLLFVVLVLACMGVALRLALWGLLLRLRSARR